MAFTAVVAIAGGAEVTAAVALAAVAEVGTAMTVVGMVTGSKSLTKIGAVMGLVGGIGGMMAGAAGTGAMDAAAASDAGNGLGSAAGNSVADAAGDATGNAMSDAAASDAGSLGSDALSGTADQASGIVGTQAMPTVAQTAPVTQSVVTPSPVGGTAAAQPAVTDVANQSGNLGPQGVTGPAGPAAPYTPFEEGFPSGTQTAATGGATPSGSFFSKFMDFANNNKQLMNTGTQLIGGALKGMSDTDIFNQKMALARDQFARANSVGGFAPQAGIIGRAA